MLPRAHRLHLSADLRSVMRRGRRFALPEAVVFVLPTPEQVSRFGVITPKRVGNAVVRHATARRIRHAWLPILAEYPQGVQLVVRAEAGADALSVEAWSDACSAAVKKAVRT